MNIDGLSRTNNGVRHFPFPVRRGPDAFSALNSSFDMSHFLRGAYCIQTGRPAACLVWRDELDISLQLPAVAVAISYWLAVSVFLHLRPSLKVTLNQCETLAAKSA
jgi:hypothetical protein